MDKARIDAIAFDYLKHLLSNDVFFKEITRAEGLLRIRAVAIKIGCSAEEVEEFAQHLSSALRLPVCIDVSGLKEHRSGW